MRSGKVIVVLSVGAVALGAAAVAQGTSVPISYALQTRSVSSSAEASGAPRGGTGTVANTVQQNQSQSAPGLGDFLGNASAAASLGAESANSSASAQQNSALGGTGFADSGFVQSSSILGTGISDSGSSSSLFHVTFKVSAAEAYTFSANLSGMGSAMGHISLTSSDGADMFTPITTDELEGFKVQGVLGAGTYSMVVDASAMTLGNESGSLHFSAALADGAVASPSVASVSQAVPAPAAWMSSTAMLGVLGLVALAKKRIGAVR